MEKNIKFIFRMIYSVIIILFMILLIPPIFIVSSFVLFFTIGDWCFGEDSFKRCLLLNMNSFGLKSFYPKGWKNEKDSI